MDADESLTLSGALTQSGNITIDVADNKTLTYSGAALNLGAIHPDPERRRGTLVSKATVMTLVLNNADSKLLLSNSHHILDNSVMYLELQHASLGLRCR